MSKRAPHVPPTSKEERPLVACWRCGRGVPQGSGYCPHDDCRAIELITYTYVSRGDLKLVKAECPAFSKIPGEEPRRVTCKRRACPRCGANWAKDQFRVASANLEFYCHDPLEEQGAVVMLTLTAPGAESLPWDEDACRIRRPHEHTGPAGCRVQADKALQWAESLTWRWQKLRGAARLQTRRRLKDALGNLGPGPTLLLRAYEPQKRGVPHLHVVLGYRTAAERDAAHVFIGEVKRLAADYEFGFADAKGKTKTHGSAGTVWRHDVEVRPMTGETAAKYLSNYLTGRNAKKKNTIRENIADPTMPSSLIWLTPALTAVWDEDMSLDELEDEIAVVAAEAERTRETNPDYAEVCGRRQRSLRARVWIQRLRERIGLDGGTGITMRMLRRARHFAAAREGRCPAPRWRDTEDAIRTMAVYAQVYSRRGPPRLAPALQIAKTTERRVKRMRQWIEYEPEITRFAAQLVARCLPPAPEAVAA